MYCLIFANVTKREFVDYDFLSLFISIEFVLQNIAQERVVVHLFRWSFVEAKAQFCISCVCYVEAGRPFRPLYDEMPFSLISAPHLLATFRWPLGLHSIRASRLYTVWRSG